MMGLDVRGSDHPRPRGASRQPAPRDPPRGGDVRARRRHVVDERLDRGGRQGPRHHREWGPIRDRARGAGLRRVHPDREQDRGPDRPQEGLRPGSARLRDRRARDDARAGPHRGHHLLGDHRRSRRVAPAAVDAVPDPRQLRRGRAAEGLRPRRSFRRDRRRGRTAARRLHHDLPVVARRLRVGGRDHRDRPAQHQAGSGRAVHRRAGDRSGRGRPLGPRHGRHRARDPRMAGRRRSGRRPAADRRDRARRSGVVAGAAQA